MAPRLPCPAPDENELDTALETSAHGQHTASPAGQHSEAEVTYQLTALTGPANRKLREFADGYPAYLQSWQDAITAWIYAPAPAPATTAPDRSWLQGNRHVAVLAERGMTAARNRPSRPPTSARRDYERRYQLADCRCPVGV